MTAPRTRRRRLLAQMLSLVLITGIFSIGLPAAPRGAQAAPNESIFPIANPDLQVACGLDILMVLDESGSVGGDKGNVQQAFRAFTSALRNTGSRLGVVEFSKAARLPLSGAAKQAYTPVTDDTIDDVFEPYISTQYDPSGNTNWEDGFRVGRYKLPRPGTQPHLVVFLTDGNPTEIVNNDNVTYDPGNPSTSANEYENKVPLTSSETLGSNSSSATATNRAVSNSNGMKALGSHVLAVAVGDGLNDSSALQRLVKISGPDIYDGTGTFDIATDDVFRVPDFDQLSEALRDAAFQLCSPSITVRKLVDATPENPNDDLTPGAGFPITTVAVPTPDSWVLPVGAVGDTATTTTGGDGFATFQWLKKSVGGARVTVTEGDPSVVLPGLEHDPTGTECSYRTPDVDDTPLVTTPVPLGFEMTIPDEAIVTCSIVNAVAPNPGIEITKFTNNVSAPDEPGPSVLVGEDVAWAYQVTNTGNVPLSGVVIADVPDDGGDPAVSVTCPGDTGGGVDLAPSITVTCTASGKARVGQYGNTATVVGSDPDGVEVTDSDVSHYFGAGPALTVVKKVNGFDANEAPGTLVPVGDPVEWSYEVTNTGNVELTGLAVSDDLQGQVTCPDTVAVGATVTCDPVSGVAVAGPYVNLGTATAQGAGWTVAASDPANYFGVESGIQVEKSTNGADAADAPGPSVPVGDPVEWSYVVTNTGNVALSGVTVTDDPTDTGDPEPTVSCSGDTGAGVALDVGASVTCTATGTARLGQYENTATAVGLDVLGRQVTDDDPSHYFGTLPGIDVLKFTNGEAADLAPGLLLGVGDPVQWSYEVTNTGNNALTGVSLVDESASAGDPPVVVSCPTDQLAAGALMTCTASGVVRAGQYENTVTASGTDGNLTVADSDTSHYFGASPSIHLEKRILDDDADTAPGPVLPVGSNAVWTYTVTNTGNIGVGSVTVVDDDPAVDVACPKIGLLTPGASLTCQATALVRPGPYMNTATATAPDPRDSEGPPLTSSDPAHYLGALPGLTIRKEVNGRDANLPPGPYVAVGDPIAWTYEVTNSGTIDMRDVTVTDDQGVEVSCPGSTLAVGASMTCTGAGTATSGAYENLGTVTGISEPGQLSANASDAAHYFGSVPSVSLEKSTNGEDADTAPGPTIAAGAAVQWQYLVTNTGNVDLFRIAITDDQGVTVTCPDGPLSPGGTRVCLAEGTAIVGQYANEGTVTATDPDGKVVTANDSSHYFGAQSGITVQKATNGQDADAAPGPYLSVGDQVTWTYVVTNSGNQPLAGVTLEDTREGPVACPRAELAPGEAMACERTGLALPGQYNNVAIASGTDPLGAAVSATDPSYYFGVTSELVVEKSVNGDEADTAPGPHIPVGGEVDWEYRVSNAGNTALTDVRVVDDQGVAVDCPRDVLEPAPDAASVMICTGSGKAVAGSYRNIAFVTAVDASGVTVAEQDPAFYYGYTSGVRVEKSTNGADADLPQGPTIPLGGAVVWTYRVFNTGNIGISSFTVADSDPSVTVLCVGSGRIPPGGHVDCSAQGVAESGPYANTATVTALDELENNLTAEDPSHYVGTSPWTVPVSVDTR